jgi:osmotically-inducible protein OsmY
MADPPPVVTDDAIADHVRAQLRWDSRLDHDGIRVTVEDGTVTLAGHVPTFFARNAAVATTLSVLGVTDVNNDLDVRREGAEAAATTDDTTIRASVEDVLRFLPDVDASEMEVSATDGIVTLDGTVDAYWQKIHVEEVATNVAGVVSIRNKLHVAPPEAAVDDDVADAVREALRRHALVDAGDVSVTVRQGLVTLDGTVATHAARQAAHEAARYTLGVVDVQNRLAVNPAR